MSARKTSQEGSTNKTHPLNKRCRVAGPGVKTIIAEAFSISMILRCHSPWQRINQSSTQAHPVSSAPESKTTTPKAAARLPSVSSTSSKMQDVASERLHASDETSELQRGDSRSQDNSAVKHSCSARRHAESPVAAPRKLQKPASSSDQREREPLGNVVSSPVFPPLPRYGPPTFRSRCVAVVSRTSAFLFAFIFLTVVIVASIITSIPRLVQMIKYKLSGGDFEATRPFHDEEHRRADIRRHQQRAWNQRASAANIGGDEEGDADDFIPTEGGKDPIVCDVSHYARRVGLDVDVLQVRTEDGFLIDLWHVYDPKEYDMQAPSGSRDNDAKVNTPRKTLKAQVRPKYPVLLLHGLLQSSGTFCCNDDDSLAFWLCKAGFDVWLGNNRCGIKPSHESLKYSDSRMWSWTIQHMGVLDLPALASSVLAETGFEKLGLICHSQGTAQTMVALAKDQRPELGEKLSVFCALAPAAYAGPLLGKFYFCFIRRLPPFFYRVAFGTHAFIPFMMYMHSSLNSRIYGWLGYRVFSHLFGWTDARWDRGLRNRFFQFAPVYVSAETMRWWLGKGGFSHHGCILSTQDAVQFEEQRDMLRDHTSIEAPPEASHSAANDIGKGDDALTEEPWFNEMVPPFAMWVCGNDRLVDGRKLLRRFERGGEPNVELVYSKVIECYEHLDVIWAIDAVDRVFADIREVLWRTCPDRDRCRVPAGCAGVPAWKPKGTA